MKVDSKMIVRMKNEENDDDIYDYTKDSNETYAEERGIHVYVCRRKKGSVHFC